MDKGDVAEKIKDKIGAGRLRNDIILTFLGLLVIHLYMSYELGDEALVKILKFDMLMIAGVEVGDKAMKNIKKYLGG